MIVTMEQQLKATTLETTSGMTMTNHSATSIDKLNHDILLRIFDYLDFDDKIRLRRTCKKWKQLLDRQMRQVRALRLGQFHLGGYQVTSGLMLKCDKHQYANRQQFHRQETGSLFNTKIFQMPADLETQCYSINRYDHLHRALRHSYQAITMLALGRVQISYRLLIVLTHNLPNLEHLELINCATQLELNKQSHSKQNHLPSLDSFSPEECNATIDQVRQSINSHILYNQHDNEQLNVRERLLRSSFIKNCGLIRDARKQRQWSKMQHLLVRESNLMNEFTLCLLLSLTSQSLTHLEIEKNQYLTGEFLNYCGPNLKILKLRHCPSVRGQFVDDLVRIRKLLGSSIQFGECPDKSQSSSSLKFNTSGTDTFSSRAALLAILFNA